MIPYVFANNVQTTLSSSISSAATTCTVASTANLPTIPTGSYWPLTFNDAATGLVYEVVYVTAITGATLTISRGEEGTTAQAWGRGDIAFGAATEGPLEAYSEEISSVIEAAGLTPDKTNNAQLIEALESKFAALGGSDTQTFSVDSATAADQAVNLGQFPASLTSPGYQVLPSGLIMQSGLKTVSLGAFNSQTIGSTTFYTYYVNITFPTAFQFTTFSALVTPACPVFASQSSMAGVSCSANLSGTGNPKSSFTVAITAPSTWTSIVVHWEVIGQ